MAIRIGRNTLREIAILAYTWYGILLLLIILVFSWIVSHTCKETEKMATIIQWTFLPAQPILVVFMIKLLFTTLRRLRSFIEELAEDRLIREIFIVSGGFDALAWIIATLAVLALGLAYGRYTCNPHIMPPPALQTPMMIVSKLSLVAFMAYMVSIVAALVYIFRWR